MKYSDELKLNILTQMESEYGIDDKNFRELKRKLEENNESHFKTGTFLHELHCLICGSTNDDCICEDK